VIAPARTAAFHALRAITAGRADLPAALAVSRQRLTDERDRSLAAEIVTGTLRWRRSIDHLVVHFANNRPLAKIDADVLTVLRLSLYQLLHLDRVPASAVVDDAVDLTRAVRRAGAAGFVNAVLRSILRQRHHLPLPQRPVDSADVDAVRRYLGTTHSHPDWLVERWLSRTGFANAEQWVRFNNETPRLTLRVNTLVATRDQVRRTLADDGIATEPTGYAPHGLTVLAGNPLRATAGGNRHLFVVQDEASQLVALAVAARPGERVLDLCASPGGKTTALAGDMRDRGVLVATDVRPRRISLLHDTVRASGAASVRIAHIDPAAALPFRRQFDRVLVDAPCSGLGTVRRDPDIKWRRTESDLAMFANNQQALLHRAADVVAPGGRLVYATCSSEPEENDDVIAAFQSDHPAFQRLDLRREPLLSAVCDQDGLLRTLPFRHRLEAFFAAALERTR
jgi:16S rRNA (cytosine967-C5)-methyltransferase